MPRSGPRPHTWKVQGEIPHAQYLAWLQMKAQASYRKEEFSLTFEEFQELWRHRWNMKGRGVDDYCLTRKDPYGPWNMANAECIPRRQHLVNSGRYKQEKRNGKHTRRTVTL